MYPRAWYTDEEAYPTAPENYSCRTRVDVEGGDWVGWWTCRGAARGWHVGENATRRLIVWAGLGGGGGGKFGSSLNGRGEGVK